MTWALTSILSGIAHVGALSLPSIRMGVIPPKFGESEQLFTSGYRVGESSLRAETKHITGFKGPWGHVAQDDDTEFRNLCDADKQLPDLYLIGQQKCGTTSLAADLTAAGVVNVHGPSNPKEFHFFDAPTRLNFSLEGPKGIRLNRAAWREWMPKCPRSNGTEYGPRRVLADFTPAYLATYPIPSVFKTTGPWLNAYKHSANAPDKMKELYGDEATPKVRIVIMVREPLSQMQSAWYHAQSFNFTNVCASCRSASFKDSLQSAIQGLQQNPPEINQWVWNVMYGRHIEEWLRHFDASQLYLIPTHIFSKGNNTAICEDLSQRLAFKMECKRADGETESTHTWTHAHPSVEEEVVDLRTPFEEKFQNEHHHLVSILADATRRGMGLANYQGQPGDYAAIDSWLKGGW